jgi:hypothetical protein
MSSSPSKVVYIYLNNKLEKIICQRSQKSMINIDPDYDEMNICEDDEQNYFFR